MIAVFNTGHREDTEVKESGCETRFQSARCSPSVEDERLSHGLLAQSKLCFRKSPVLMGRCIRHCLSFMLLESSYTSKEPKSSLHFTKDLSLLC